MFLWLKLVVGNVLHYTKFYCLVLQLNRAKIVAKRQCISCFGTEVLQKKVYFHAIFFKIQIHIVTTRLFSFF